MILPLKLKLCQLRGRLTVISVGNDNKQEDTLNGQLLNYINCNL